MVAQRKPSAPISLIICWSKCSCRLASNTTANSFSRQYAGAQSRIIHSSSLSDASKRIQPRKRRLGIRPQRLSRALGLVAPLGHSGSAEYTAPAPRQPKRGRRRQRDQGPPCGEREGQNNRSLTKSTRLFLSCGSATRLTA